MIFVVDGLDLKMMLFPKVEIVEKIIFFSTTVEKKYNAFPIEINRTVHKDETSLVCPVMLGVRMRSWHLGRPTYW